MKNKIIPALNIGDLVTSYYKIVNNKLEECKPVRGIIVEFKSLDVDKSENILCCQVYLDYGKAIYTPTTHVQKIM